MMLILISICFASLNSTLLHLVECKTKRDTFQFNLLSSIVWIFLLMIVGDGLHPIGSSILFWGVAYGFVQVLFLIFKMKAMSTGEISITTLIGNCSLVLSTAVSVILWNEQVSIFQVIGIVMLIFAVFICTYTKTTSSGTPSWKWFCVGFFILAAMVGILFKAFSKSGYGENANDMMIIAAFVMSLLLAILSSVSKVGKKSDIKQKSASHPIRFFVMALLCGALSCAYNRLNITLSGMLPSAFFFPAFNGGVIILSGILGKYILKEVISKRKIVGLILGIFSIIIIGMHSQIESLVRVLNN